MPLFVVVAISVVTVQFPILRTTAIIASTIVGASFSVLICSTLLNTEGGATEYSVSLPIRQRIVVEAKSIVATLTFIPVPLTMVAIALSKNVTSLYSVFIPFVELIAMGAACLAEIAFFTRRKRGGTEHAKGYSLLAGSEMFRLFESTVISFVILLIPILIYSIVFLEGSSHLLAIELMSVAAVGEFIVSTMIARYFTNFA
jgi:hypothetical protein